MEKRYETFETLWIFAIGPDTCRIEYCDDRVEDHPIRAKRMIQRLNANGWWVSAADYPTNANPRYVMSRECEE